MNKWVDVRIEHFVQKWIDKTRKLTSEDLKSCSAAWLRPWDQNETRKPADIMRNEKKMYRVRSYLKRQDDRKRRNSDHIWIRRCVKSIPYIYVSKCDSFRMNWQRESRDYLFFLTTVFSQGDWIFSEFSQQKHDITLNLVKTK